MLGLEFFAKLSKIKKKKKVSGYIPFEIINQSNNMLVKVDIYYTIFY